MHGMNHGKDHSRRREINNGTEGEGDKTRTQSSPESPSNTSSNSKSETRTAPSKVAAIASAHLRIRAARPRARFPGRGLTILIALGRRFGTASKAAAGLSAWISPIGGCAEASGGFFGSPHREDRFGRGGFVIFGSGDSKAAAGAGSSPKLIGGEIRLSEKARDKYGGGSFRVAWIGKNRLLGGAEAGCDCCGLLCLIEAGSWCVLGEGRCGGP